MWSGMSIAADSVTEPVRQDCLDLNGSRHSCSQCPVSPVAGTPISWQLLRTRGTWLASSTRAHVQTRTAGGHRRSARALSIADDGEVATYIPELGKANPDHFGICVVTADGACSRPATATCRSPSSRSRSRSRSAWRSRSSGQDTVSQHVGVEPSGDAFNSIELQNGTNRPHNPMINSGAITVTALLHARYGDAHVRHDARAVQRRRRPAAVDRSRRSTSPNGGPAIATAPSPICC